MNIYSLLLLKLILVFIISIEKVYPHYRGYYENDGYYPRRYRHNPWRHRYVYDVYDDRLRPRVWRNYEADSDEPKEASNSVDVVQGKEDIPEEVPSGPDIEMPIAENPEIEREPPGPIPEPGPSGPPIRDDRDYYERRSSGGWIAGGVAGGIVGGVVVDNGYDGRYRRHYRPHRGRHHRHRRHHRGRYGGPRYGGRETIAGGVYGGAVGGVAGGSYSEHYRHEPQIKQYRG